MCFDLHMCCSGADMMDVDEPSASGRAALSQDGSNVVGMLICATTECQSKHARLHHGLFGIASL